MEPSSSSSKSSPGAFSLDAVAKGLGVFSIGLGLAELLAPRAMARATGMRGRETLIQAYGLREIAAGVGLLVSRNPRPWLWGRVAGDAIDVSTLAAQAVRGNGLAKNAKLAMMAVAPVVALDYAAARISDGKAKARAGARFDYSDRIGMAKPAEAMRGAAKDFMAPRDMRQPAPLRAYATP